MTKTAGKDIFLLLLQLLFTAFDGRFPLSTFAKALKNSDKNHSFIRFGQVKFHTVPLNSRRNGHFFEREKCNLNKNFENETLIWIWAKITALLSLSDVKYASEKMLSIKKNQFSSVCWMWFDKMNCRKDCFPSKAIPISFNYVITVLRLPWLLWSLENS